MKFTFAPESKPLEGYTIKRAIYRGGFGEVYYAQTDAGREVALKLLQNNADIELRGVQQCLNLSHPNLVTIFDVRQDGDGDHWIIMEYVSGSTLDAVLRKSPNGLPVETVRKWLHGMTAGVAYLHSRGLVHRDMKPANVFMENQIVKIGDVGLSKFISPSRHSAQTQSVGTVHYMAPEVAKGKYGREVDIYAMGIILYEMLTGDLPFDGESTGEILMKHLSEEPDLERLPPRLRGVIGKALQKDPKDRFSRVEALQRAFDDAVLGIAPAVEPVATKTENPASEKSIDETSHASATAQKETDAAGRAHLKSTAHYGEPYQSPSRFSVPNAVKGGLLGFLAAMVFAQFGEGDKLLWPFVIISAIVGGYYRSRKHRRRATEQKAAQPAPPKRLPGRATASHTLSSMFLTVPISSALVACMAIFKPSMLGSADDFNGLDIAFVGQFVAVTILASWAITIVPLLKRHNFKHHQLSKYNFAIAGLGVGAAAYAIQRYLLISSAGGMSNAMFKHIGDLSLFADGAPSLAGYMAFFAAFFGLRDWQEMISPLRKYRFSIASVLITVFSSWLATAIFAFPSELAIAWGVVIACTTQLASPIEDQPQQRSRGRRTNTYVRVKLQ